MKAIRYLFLILLLMAGPAILESCFCPCGCDFGNNVGNGEFDFEGMSMSLWTIESTPLPPTAIKFSRIIFDVGIDMRYTMATSLFGTSVYACEPPPPIANQRITSVNITSDRDYVGTPATIPAGNELAILFKVHTDYGNVTIDEFVNKEFRGWRLAFSTDAMADSPQTHTFTFRVTLDNGQVFEMVTPTVNLSAG
jgi:hypothetical protein